MVWSAPVGVEVRVEQRGARDEVLHCRGLAFGAGVVVTYNLGGHGVTYT